MCALPTTRKARKAARRRKQRRRRRFLKAFAERTVRLGDYGVAVDRGGVLRQFVRGIGAAQRQYIGLGVAIAGRGKGNIFAAEQELDAKPLRGVVADLDLDRLEDRKSVV